MQIKKPLINEEFKKEIRKCLKKNIQTNDYTTLQNLREAIKNGSEREVSSDNGLPQGKRKISNKKPNLQAKWVRKRRKKVKVKRKEIIKIREKINKVELKIEKINTIENLFYKKLKKME